MSHQRTFLDPSIKTSSNGHTSHTFSKGPRDIARRVRHGRVAGVAALALVAFPLSAAAQGFMDGPPEGDCRWCPPILAADVGGEVEWGVEHVGFSLDQEVWNDVVDLLDRLIDKIPGGDTGDGDPGGDPPEEPGGQDPGGEEPGGDQPGGDEPGGQGPGGEDPGGENPEESQSAGDFKGRIVLVAEPLAAPQVVKQGDRYYMVYRLHKDALAISNRLVVTEAVRLLTAPDESAEIIIPRGEYRINQQGVLRVPLAQRKL